MCFSFSTPDLTKDHVHTNLPMIKTMPLCPPNVFQALQPHQAARARFMLMLRFSSPSLEVKKSKMCGHAVFYNSCVTLPASPGLRLCRTGPFVLVLSACTAPAFGCSRGWQQGLSARWCGYSLGWFGLLESSGGSNGVESTHPDPMHIWRNQCNSLCPVNYPGFSGGNPFGCTQPCCMTAIPSNTHLGYLNSCLFSLVTHFFYLASHLGSSFRLTASSLWWDSLRPREGRLPREHPSFAPTGGAQSVQPRPQLEANYCHKISTADFQHPAFVQMLWEGGMCLGEAGKRSYF